MGKLLDVRNLSVSCRGRPVLHDVSFSLPENSVTSIVGPSGVGKTTLLRAINRLLEEGGGQYRVRGEIRLRQKSLNGPGVNPYELRRKIGLVFQKPTIFPISIYKNVIFGARHVAPGTRKEYSALVEKCLKDSFLWEEVRERLGEPALQLSIGQQQRLAISRSLAVSPEILMMDEPTASLDAQATSQIEKLIVRLGQEKSVFFVTHDPEQAVGISDQIVVLKPSPQGAVARVLRGQAAFDHFLKSYNREGCDAVFEADSGG